MSPIKAQSITIEIIEKEITLNENYFTNMKKILEELKEKKYIHPLRTFNFGGLISKPFNEKKDYKSEAVFDKLDELNNKIADWIKEKNKSAILFLRLNNNNEKQNVKLVINLENFYLLGFINNQNQYFHFENENIDNEIKVFIEKIEKSNELISEEIKERKSKTKNENRIIDLNQQLKSLESDLHEEYSSLKSDLEKKLKPDEKKLPSEIKYDKNSLQKLKTKIKKLVGLNLEEEKESEKLINDKIVNQYECEKKSLSYTGAYSEQGLNVSKKSKNENLDKKNFLGLSKGFLLSNNKNKEKNKFIKISKETLEESIKNLANYNQNTEEEIKYDLTRIIFITSEAMRFQCDKQSLKLFSKIKNNEQLKKIINESKNILDDVQNAINKKNQLNWNDYEKQIIGGWNDYSKEINNFRIEIWEQLINIKKIQNFVNKNKAKIDEIFNNIHQYKEKIEQQFENMIASEISEKDKELNEVILRHLTKELSIKEILFYFHNKLYVKKINWNDFQKKHIFHIENKDNLLLIASIYQNNLDIVKLLINLNPESMVVNGEKNCFVVPLFVSLHNQNLDIMEELLKHPKIDVNKLVPILNISCLVYVVAKNNLEAVKELLNHPKIDVNIKSICDVTALHIVVVKNNLEIFEELLKHPELNINCVTKKDEEIEDHPLIVTKWHELLKNYNVSNDEMNIQDIEFTPLILAELFGRKKIIEELKNDARIDTKKSLKNFIEIELEKNLNSKEFEDESEQIVIIELIKILEKKIRISDELLKIETLDLEQKEKIEKSKKEIIKALEEIFEEHPNFKNWKPKSKSKFEEEIEKIISPKINELVNSKEIKEYLEDVFKEAKKKQDESQLSKSWCKLKIEEINEEQAKKMGAIPKGSKIVSSQIESRYKSSSSKI